MRLESNGHREMTAYPKTSHERVCAAARKIRVQTEISVPPACAHAVDAVVGALEEQGVGLQSGLELARVVRELMAVADAEPVGPGTPRWTVAGAAVYLADKRTDGKAVSQRDVVDAVEAFVATSRKTLRTYVARLEDAC